VFAFVADQFSVALCPLTTALGPTLRVSVGASPLTVTVVDCDASPPAPEQVSTYVEFCDTLPVDCEPRTDLVPDQAPEAIHEVAFVELQLSVELVPVPTVPGDALRLTVGEGAATDTIVDWAALPCGPVQVNVNVDFSETGPLDCVPLVAFLPDQPPEATQESAFSEDQVRVEVPPGLTVVGVARSTTTGADWATETVVDCVTEPAGPVHTSWYSVVYESSPVDQVPLGAKGPRQPPNAAHTVALRALHVRTETPFFATVGGSAVRVRVGSADAVVVPPALGMDASITALFTPLFAADSPHAASAPASVHTASPCHRRLPAIVRSFTSR
jgi:hypothetical protein